MKLKKINSNSNKIILLFLGYSFNPSCVKHLYNSDLIVVYDYQDLNFDPSFLKDKEIYLIAWSMGVWVANLVLSDLPLKYALAINGTPFGIDDHFGIPAKSFKKSIEEFDFEFFKRNCFLNEISKVNFTFNKNPKLELENIYINALKPSKNNIKWDKVIISKRDLIFPPKACEWFNCKKVYINSSHFVFFKFNNIGEIFEI